LHNPTSNAGGLAPAQSKEDSREAVHAPCVQYQPANFSFPRRPEARCRAGGDEIQSGTVDWGKNLSKKWLKVLNENIIGPKNNYLVGDQLTIADYFGAGLLTSGELIGCDFSAYPNVKRWLDNVKKSPSWGKVNEVFYSVRDSVKSQQFVTV